MQGLLVPKLQAADVLELDAVRWILVIEKEVSNGQSTGAKPLNTEQATFRAILNSHQWRTIGSQSLVLTVRWTSVAFILSRSRVHRPKDTLTSLRESSSDPLPTHIPTYPCTPWSISIRTASPSCRRTSMARTDWLMRMFQTSMHRGSGCLSCNGLECKAITSPAGGQKRSSQIRGCCLTRKD